MHLNKFKELGKRFLVFMNMHFKPNFNRHLKRWDDNIMEWTGLTLKDSLRKSEDQEG